MYGFLGNLLENCEKFSAGEIDLQTAFASHDEVLKFNHKHGFLVHFKRAFSSRKKPKH
jgi:hypothetical protein